MWVQAFTPWIQLRFVVHFLGFTSGQCGRQLRLLFSLFTLFSNTVETETIRDRFQQWQTHADPVGRKAVPKKWRVRKANAERFDGPGQGLVLHWFRAGFVVSL